MGISDPIRHWPAPFGLKSHLTSLPERKLCPRGDFVSNPRHLPRRASAFRRAHGAVSPPGRIMQRIAKA
ncbi:protein of unknown function (plasmid) [Methylocella tundrae]|uniref:Uncharacterized protein n=1 Tax=Methylocella tundrae TaxID=227605 RepID=A0A4U8Z6E8_METTU|nr:protein of unknown function [Methylocella tundrae]